MHGGVLALPVMGNEDEVIDPYLCQCYELHWMLYTDNRKYPTYTCKCLCCIQGQIVSRISNVCISLLTTRKTNCWDEKG